MGVLDLLEETKENNILSLLDSKPKVGEDTKFFEGWRSNTYQDPGGKNQSIGWGFNVDDPFTSSLLPEDVKSKKRSLTKEEAEPIFQQKYKIAEEEAKTFLGEDIFNSSPKEVQDIITDMTYNMGLPTMSTFKKLKKAVEDKDWNKAADELKNSNWYRQTGQRGRKHEDTLRKLVPKPQSSLSDFLIPSAEASGKQEETISQYKPNIFERISQFHRTFQRGAENVLQGVIEKDIPTYMQEGQSAMKLFGIRPDVALGFKEDITPEELNLTQERWADVIKGTYPALKTPESKLAQSVSAQFLVEMAGDLLDMGTRPSTFIAWGVMERVIPKIALAAFKKFPKGIQQALLKERPLWGRKPIELAYREFGLKSGAKFSDVEKAYRTNAIKFHPDRAPAGQAVNYTRKFINNQAAYEKIKASTTIIREVEKLGRGVIARKAQVPIPFEKGDVVQFGKDIGKIISIEGTKALLNIAGKEVSASIADLKPVEAPEPLIEEAKKYKTAEEFVASERVSLERNKELSIPANFEHKEILGFDISKKGNKVGSISYEKVDNKVKIVDVNIDKDFQRQGLAVDAISQILEKENATLSKGMAETKAGKLLREVVQKGKKFDKSQLTDIWKKAQVKPEVTKPEKATQTQKIEAHRIAKEKALITPEGKTKPQYRRLATLTTGKRSMAEMTESEADEFIYNLQRISEPVYKKGKLVPPTIPRTKALVEPGFFLREFKRPTIAKLVTSQTRYAELLGVKKLVAPMEIGKQELDIEYSTGAHQIDVVNKKLKQIKGISSEEMAKTLNIHEEAPATLSNKEKEVFDYYRSLTRDLLIRENEVRRTLDLPPIRERKAYFRHIADRMSQEIIDGKYPLPEGLKYWSEQTVGKKVYNPMEMQRKLRDDLLERFSSNLPYVMKSMLWSGLKEIHLSIPKHILNKELGTLTRDKKVYRNLSPQEQKLYDATTIMPAPTKKWLLDYVNIVLGGRQTALDESVNLWITDTPIKTVVNNILRPFGELVGQKPLTHMISSFSKLPIYGAMGGINPRQLIRNKFQTLQNMALYGVKNTLKGYQPISSYPVLKELKTDSLFRKSYSGFEDMPTGTMKRIEKIGLAPYQWTAISNVSQAMNSAYHWTTDNIQNPKKAHLGWADPQRTYEEPKDFFYPSEKAKLLKEMEYGAHTTQYQYIGLGMPEIFRYKALAPFTRLQSWWMNHWFVFHREAATRAFTGHTGYDPDLKIRLGDRLNYLKYLILGGLILVNLGYYRSYLFGTAPTSVSPTAQLMMGLYDLATNTGDTSWEKRKRGQAGYRVWEALKIHLPGYLSIKDTTALIKGDKHWTEYLFYKKGKKKTSTEETFKLIGGGAKKSSGGILGMLK